MLQSDRRCPPCGQSSAPSEPASGKQLSLQSGNNFRNRVETDSVLGIPPPEPMVSRAPSFSARVTWVSFHLSGFLFLWLSGRWPSLESGWFLATLTLLTAASYVWVATGNPGYIPGGDQPASYALSHGSKHTALLSGDHPLCTHCFAQQPPRAKHCFDCGRCVRRLDHHCWWLGNCVGQDNHRSFVVYLLLQVMLICVLGITVTFGSGPPSPPIPALAGISTVSCVILASVLGLLAGTLFCFQSALVWRGETTWEHLRRPKLNSAQGLPPDVRPYDRGPLHNFQTFWGCFCLGQPQSSVTFQR
mmetsp:Transcript_9134/g.18561  ORF Transcript_9134/g.18561 Transcript_9134/m.18561 type:complete len:303 (-) Transcript_9134:199-1107(-)